MSNIVNKVKKDIWKNQIINNYSNRNRYIPQCLYQKLKLQRICDYCGKRQKKNQIHHIIAVEDNGTCEEKNLMSVHIACHEILDAKYKKAKENNTLVDYLKHIEEKRKKNAKNN